ncbi:MAG: hypothetical protein CMJ94_13520 [Planctomycetes bacterium]|nr:hypothetical protein [Planctomycetota bacterium]
MVASGWDSPTSRETVEKDLSFIAPAGTDFGVVCEAILQRLTTEFLVSDVGQTSYGVRQKWSFVVDRVWRDEAVLCVPAGLENVSITAFPISGGAPEIGAKGESLLGAENVGPIPQDTRVEAGYAWQRATVAIEDRFGFPARVLIVRVVRRLPEDSPLVQGRCTLLEGATAEVVADLQERFSTQALDWSDERLRAEVEQIPVPGGGTLCVEHVLHNPFGFSDLELEAATREAGREGGPAVFGRPRR